MTVIFVDLSTPTIPVPIICTICFFDVGSYPKPKNTVSVKVSPFGPIPTDILSFVNSSIFLPAIVPWFTAFSILVIISVTLNPLS